MEYIPEGTRLSDSSRKMFNKKIAQYISFMGQSRQSVGFIVDNPGIAYETLLAEESISQTPTNRHLFFSAIVAYIKHTDDGRRRSDRIKNKWFDIQKTNWHKQQLIDDDMSDKDEAVATNVSWSDLEKVRDSLPKSSKARLLLALYTYLPPLRADYFEVRINPPKTLITATKKNYIQLNSTAETSELVIRDFKTSATYKTIRHKIPQQLYEDITASLESEPRNYLFTMATDAKRPYDRNSFSKWANKVLQDLFKVPITLTAIRHIFISTLDLTKMRARDLQNIAHAMGHGIAMQKEYQWH